MSFAASLDCFYELFVKVYLLQINKQESDINELLKSIYLSERRFGAFMSTHLIAFGDLPNKLKSSSVKLRNDVVHNGKFPNLIETKKFGQECLEILLPATLRVKSDMRDGTRRERDMFFENSKTSATSSNWAPVSLISIIPYSTSRFHMLDTNLDELIDHHKEDFDWYN